MAKAPRKRSARGNKPAARKPSPKPKAKTVRSRPARISGGYEITCSECYSTFQFSPSVNAEEVTCPDCLHAGNMAEADVMSNVAIAKSGESSSLLQAIIPTILFFVVGLIYTYLLTSKAAEGETMASGMHYGFAGVGALLFILMVWLGIKYETKRYDVYF